MSSFKKVTVGELIAELSKHPVDSLVLLHDADTNWLFSDPVVYEDKQFVVIASADDYSGRHHDSDEAAENLR